MFYLHYLHLFVSKKVLYQKKKFGKKRKIFLFQTDLLCSIGHAAQNTLDNIPDIFLSYLLFDLCKQQEIL